MPDRKINLLDNPRLFCKHKDVLCINQQCIPDMKIYTLYRPAQSLVTMRFDNYTQARAFATAYAPLKASKPFKKMSDKQHSWHVTLPKREYNKATYCLNANTDV
jgi:hypothetical protein